MKLLISGCHGFFMSGVIRRVLADPELKHVSIRGIARNTNQKHLQRLAGIDTSRFELIYKELAGDVSGLHEGIDATIHGAALTFVNRSIVNPESFVQDNVVATVRLLEDARRYRVKRWVQISTDEVLGSIMTGSHDERAPLNPSNPYSAGKAGAEAFCMAYAKSYGLNTVIGRFENLHGSYQGVEKMIPTCCRALLDGKKCPVYAPGNHVRQWLALSDAISGVLHLLNLESPPGEVYHVAGSRECTNLKLAKIICDGFGLGDYANHIELVDASVVRAGHDFRYALSTEKIRATGWSARVELEEGILQTVSWYRAHPDWLK